MSKEYTTGFNPAEEHPQNGCDRAEPDRGKMMKAQMMYDLRAKYEFCSGTELMEFFREQTGDPSPGGNTEVDAAEAFSFTRGFLVKLALNGTHLSEKERNEILDSIRR